MGSFSRQSHRMEIGKRRRQWNPFHRRPAGFQRVEIMHVGGERPVEFTGGYQLGQERSADAQIGFLRGERAHESQAFFLSHAANGGGEPFVTAAFDADLPLPKWFQKIVVGAWYVGLRDRSGVETKNSVGGIGRSPIGLRILKAVAKIFSF